MSPESGNMVFGPVGARAEKEHRHRRDDQMLELEAAAM
jgi:hypothetical protein